MKRFELESYKKVFNFIPEHYKGDIFVEKFNETVLSQSFQDFEWNGSNGNSYDYYSADFVLENEQVLENAVKVGKKSGSNYAHSETIDIDGETIAETIDRLDVANKLKYIAIYNNGYSNWDEKKEWHRLTIYKLPDGNYIEKLISKIKKEIDIKTKKIIENAG